MLDWGPTGTCQLGMTGEPTSCVKGAVAEAAFKPLSWGGCAAALKLDVAWGAAKKPAEREGQECCVKASDLILMMETPSRFMALPR